MIETRQSLLKDIAHELHKAHPDRLCESVLTFNNTVNALTDEIDLCHVEFMVDGERVKPAYVIVTNSSDGMNVNVTINEPISPANLGAAACNGIPIHDQFNEDCSLIIEAEVQYLEIRFPINGPYEVAINNSLGRVPAQGTISVQGYVPHTRKD